MHQTTYELALALRHELHQYPELSCEEQGTKARLMAFLKAHTKLEIVDRGRWFYAVHRGRPEGKKLAFRADMDALPIDETIDLPMAPPFPVLPTNAVTTDIALRWRPLPWKLTVWAVTTPSI